MIIFSRKSFSICTLLLMASAIGGTKSRFLGNVSLITAEDSTLISDQFTKDKIISFDKCTIGTFTHGFALKRASNVDLLSGIHLSCRTLSEPVDIQYITSNQGQDGIWGSDHYCKENEFIVGIRMYRVFKYHGISNFEFTCSDQNVVKGDGFMESPGLGFWIRVVQCPTKQVICGMQTYIANHSDQNEPGKNYQFIRNAVFKCCIKPTGDSTSTTTSSTTTITTPSLTLN